MADMPGMMQYGGPMMPSDNDGDEMKPKKPRLKLKPKKPAMKYVPKRPKALKQMPIKVKKSVSPGTTPPGGTILDEDNDGGI